VERDELNIPRALELRHLRYFVAVAEELHFGRAARRLNLAQPPLSQQIRQLEDLVGCALLVRTSRSVQLTPAGAAFLDRARRTLRNVQDDVQEARSIARGARGVLRIGFAGSAILTVLPGLLGRYRAQEPNVELNLRESFTAQVVDGLLSGALDAGIVRDMEPVPGLHAHVIASEPFVAVLPADHPEAGRASVPVTVLRDRPFVYYPRSAGARAYEKPLSVCEAAGFRPVASQEASQWLTILRLVGAGLGVSLAPACVAGVAPANVVCLPLQGVSLESELQVVRRTDDRRPLVRSFEALALEG